MKPPMGMPLLFPLLAIITIVVYGGGLGGIFMLLYDTPLHEWAVIILGVALVVGVPAVAALLQRRVEES